MEFARKEWEKRESDRDSYPQMPGCAATEPRHPKNEKGSEVAIISSLPQRLSDNIMIDWPLLNEAPHGKQPNFILKKEK